MVFAAFLSLPLGPPASPHPLGKEPRAGPCLGTGKGNRVSVWPPSRVQLLLQATGLSVVRGCVTSVRKGGDGWQNGASGQNSLQADGISQATGI